MKRSEHRRAPRLLVNIPVTAESIGQPPLTLHEKLVDVYQRVEAAEERRGETVLGHVRDLSTNGAFIAADPLPLMSRVAVRFTLEELGPIEAIGWVLWRRSEAVAIERSDGSTTELDRGFGVLFEALSLKARSHIHTMVERASRVSS